MYKEKHTLKKHYGRHKLSRYVDVYETTLQTDGNGTINASKLTGYAGDTITLSNTPNAGFIFNDYNITGATLTGSNFNFVGNDVTAKANFTMTSFVPTGSMGKYYNDDQSTREVTNLSASGSCITMIPAHIQDVFNWPATAHYAAATYTLKTESMRGVTERIGGGYFVTKASNSSPNIGPSANVIVSSVYAPTSGATFGPARLGIIIDVANSSLSSFVNRNFNFTETNVPSPPAFLTTNCSGNSVIMSGVTMRTFGSYDDAYNFIQLWQ